uniref:Uncharacterized protein n=1 Tax=Timema poppense TaxID=170557 RepID=A0A7R9D8F0_TIMPO|nr:unnamed protein product [Timema poppensis]
MCSVHLNFPFRHPPSHLVGYVVRAMTHSVLRIHDGPFFELFTIKTCIIPSTYGVIYILVYPSRRQLRMLSRPARITIILESSANSAVQELNDICFYISRCFYIGCGSHALKTPLRAWARDLKETLATRLQRLHNVESCSRVIRTLTEIHVQTPEVAYPQKSINKMEPYE